MSRSKDSGGIFAVFNFSGDSSKVTFRGSLHHGKYRDFPNGQAVSLDEEFVLDMKPWSYRLFESDNQ